MLKKLEQVVSALVIAATFLFIGWIILNEIF